MPEPKPHVIESGSIGIYFYHPREGLMTVDVDVISDVFEDYCKHHADELYMNIEEIDALIVFLQEARREM